MAGHLPSDRQSTDDLPGFAGRSIHAFPSADASFRESISAAIGNLGHDGVPPLEELEELLRPSYPDVRVVEQTELGSFVKESAIYVFRDGSVGPRAGDGPGTMCYVSLSESVQRACVRNVVARHRSGTLVGQAVVAIERSRARTASTAFVATAR